MERPGLARRHSIIFSVAIYLTGSTDGGWCEEKNILNPEKIKVIKETNVTADNNQKVSPFLVLLFLAVMFGKV